MATPTRERSLTTRVKRGAAKGAATGAMRGAVKAARPPSSRGRPRAGSDRRAGGRSPTRLRTALADGFRNAVALLRRLPLGAWGGLLVVVGVLDALGTWAGLMGPVGRIMRAAGTYSVGSGRVAVPLVVVAVGALLALRRHVTVDPVRAGGAALAGLAATGLLGLTNGSPALTGPRSPIGRAGGYVGAAVASPLHAALASAGAALTLALVALVGLLLAARLGPRDLARHIAGAGRRAAGAGHALADWITAFPRREPEGDDEGEDLEEEDDEPAASTLVDGARAGWFDEIRPKSRRRLLPASPAELADPGTTEQLAIDLPGDAWRLPAPSLLKRTKATEIDRRPIDEGGRILEQALAAHGVETRLIATTVGPTVARYELELGPGVKVAKVTSLSKDIAYAMAAEDVRILAPIPGKSAIGVEVPNRQRQLVGLGDILASDEARRATHPLEVAVGRDINARGVMANLAEMPHILIAGATGAGKSSCINSIITSVLTRATPDQVRLILVDPKRVELGQYEGVPHLLTQVVTNPKRAANALSWVVAEMDRRYDLLHEVGFRDITGYNAAFDRGEVVAEPPLLSTDEEKTYHRLPFILVVVDELNDLMMVAARDVEESICRIAQMARAVGIHLVIATQRPSVDVITGVIKANIPSRLAFKVSSLADSRVILDQQGAEKLVGKGDMLLLTASTSVSRRIQGCWVSEEEVRKVVAHWRRQAQPVYIEGVEGSEDDMGSITGGGGSSGSDDDDDLLVEAMDLVVRSQLGSTSMLQRKLRVGFARAGRLMDLLERKGVVGPSEGSKARAVLMTVDELEAMHSRTG
jgi:DNA segregation ATPase FtsK/SpoIIIE, S-DNA-T family